MTDLKLWELNPHIIQSTYWFRKEKFAYKEDTYNEWIIFAVEDGTFQFEIGEHAGIASSGDLIVCPPGIPFLREIITPLSFHFFRFYWTGRVGERIGGRLEAMPVGRIAIHDTQRLASDYSRIKKWPNPVDPFQLHWISHHLKDILYLYCLESGDHLRSDSGRSDPLMDEACAYMERNAFEPFSMRTLSDKLGLRPVQFTRRFHAAKGTTPSEFLTRVRLQKACTLLLATTLTVDEVARQCGYESGFYLSRIFSKKLKTSPSSYRKTHQV